jgi:hypothetical protein
MPMNSNWPSSFLLSLDFSKNDFFKVPNNHYKIISRLPSFRDSALPRLNRILLRALWKTQKQKVLIAEARKGGNTESPENQSLQNNFAPFVLPPFRASVIKSDFIKGALENSKIKDFNHGITEGRKHGIS